MKNIFKIYIWYFQGGSLDFGAKKICIIFTCIVLF